MRIKSVILGTTVVSVGMASGAAGQGLEISWSSIDCGGGASAGGALELSFTVGQPESGAASGGSLVIGNGFLPGSIAVCYANCDGSTIQPILNVNDFSCFLNRYAAGDPYANCDGSSIAPTLTFSDFTCFLGKYAAGCP